MDRLHRRRIAFVLSLGSLGALSIAHLTTAPDARASAISAARFGGDHGQPALANAFSVFYNPAALGGLEGTWVVIDGSFAVRSLQYTRPTSALSPSDPSQLANPTYRAANTGDATAVNVVVVPYFGVVTDLGSKSIRLGFASYVPFGGVAKWDQIPAGAAGQPPGASDGPQRWSLISGQQQSLYNTLAFAYRFDKPRISIGVSGSLVLNSAKSLRARNADGSDDILTANGGLQEGRSLLDASGADLAATIGVYWEATPELRIGASYASQPGFGEQRLKGTFLQQFGTTAQTAQAQNIDFLQSLPDVIRLGAAWRISRDVELRADISYERWSHMKNQCVVLSGQPCNIAADGSTSDGSGSVIANFPRNWKDSVGPRVGFAYWVDADTELFGGTNFATAAIPKKTADPLYFDGNTLGFSLGAKHQFAKGLYGALSYNYNYSFPFTIASGQSQSYQLAAPSRSPSSDGTYAQSVYFFNANVAYRF